MESKVRVLLVDDHPLVLLGLSSFLRAEGRVEVVGQASSGEQALALVAAATPDLVLLDLRMPGMNGVEVARILADEHPAVRVLFLTGLEPQEAASMVAGVQASGCLSKTLAPTELVDQICAAADRVGLRPQGGGRVDRLQLASPRLSPRERQVLALLADGNSNKEIATELGLSARTVEKHRAHVMDKLGLKSVALLTKYAVAQGISAPL